MVEDIVGCKWSLGVIQMVKEGINRPGAMTRHLEGLTTKVLNQRLNKLVKYQLIRKNIFPEIPPRVEYQFTEKGLIFLEVLDAIDRVQDAFDASN